MRLLFGIAAGIVTGLLISPKSGRENREDLQRESDKLRHDMEDKLNGLLAQGREGYNKVLQDMMIDEKANTTNMKQTSKSPVKTTTPK